MPKKDLLQIPDTAWTPIAPGEKFETQSEISSGLKKILQKGELVKEKVVPIPQTSKECREMYGKGILKYSKKKKKLKGNQPPAWWKDYPGDA